MFNSKKQTEEIARLQAEVTELQRRAAAWQNAAQLAEQKMNAVKTKLEAERQEYWAHKCQWERDQEELAVLRNGLNLAQTPYVQIGNLYLRYDSIASYRTGETGYVHSINSVDLRSDGWEKILGRDLAVVVAAYYNSPDEKE